MSNKKLFKKIYFEKINKEKNYEVILSNIERKNIKTKKLKWIIVAPCLFIIFIFITLFSKDDIKLKEIEHKNNIVINNLNPSENLSTALEDIDGRFEDKNIEEFMLEFDFIKKLDAKYELTNMKQRTRCGLKYIRNELSDKNYSKLYGYSLMFTLDDQNSKTIDIFFSKSEKERLRCIMRNIILNELKDSNINNKNVKIVKIGNYYVGIFEYNDLYFDIETYNLSEEEFIELLETIIK